MTKRIVLLGAACGLLTMVAGCGCYNGFLCQPLGPGTMCDPEHCGCTCEACYGEPTCGAACPPACGPGGVAMGGPCAEPGCGPPEASVCGPDVAPVAGPCGGPACGPCYGPVCGYPCGPLSLVGWLLNANSWYGPGCGEIYWGDFHGEPPDCCDPCNRCGDYTGGHCTGGDCAGGVPADYGSGTVVSDVRVQAARQARRPHKALQQ